MADGLSLEKLRIADRLEALERTMSNYTAVNEFKMSQHTEMLEKLNKIIVGNGVKGLAESVRNLEKTDERRAKHTFVFYTAIVAGFGEWIREVLVHWNK